MNSSLYPTWFKFKGYLHIVGHLNFKKRAKEIIGKVTNADYVSSYAFYPLIHSIIKERRYKRKNVDSSERQHAYKERPLHYANHLDALIFSYYADTLQKLYEQKLNRLKGLVDSVIAYRKLPSEIEGKYKSTIHFAHEIFEEVKSRSQINGNCVVLTFDIKSFFSSLDHSILKKAWADLLGLEKLPRDHYNVFKASTLFSYIYLQDFKKENRNSYNELEFAKRRNLHGIHAFFDSPKAFRQQVKSGEVKLHKFPFRHEETNLPMGIPQGLPISAILANLYLLSFDNKIYNTLVEGLGCYYRRYSDDIILICTEENAEFVKHFVSTGIQESRVKISESKTEHFIFKHRSFGNQPPRLSCLKYFPSKKVVIAPLTYLGFEFNGQKALIKSANLAKFYRRMIYSVKSRAKRANKICGQTPDGKLAVYRRQLHRLYTTYPLKQTKKKINIKVLTKNKFGSYTLEVIERDKLLRSNYLTYVHRSANIMNEPAIFNQIKKHKTIFNQAMAKHLRKYK